MSSDIAVYGLGVMGRSLALNLADRGLQVAVYNRTAATTDAFVADHPAGTGLRACYDPAELCAALTPPRRVLLMATAGKVVDRIIDGLELRWGTDPLLIDDFTQGEYLWDAAGAATIDGDPGYLVRFKTKTVGERSQVYDDGNKVGIGTTTPAQRLEVNGSIQINEQNSSVAGLMITQSGGETGYIMHNRASTLTIGAGALSAGVSVAATLYAVSFESDTVRYWLVVGGVTAIAAVLDWVGAPTMRGCAALFPSRFRDSPHLSTRQNARWCGTGSARSGSTRPAAARIRCGGQWLR